MKNIIPIFVFFALCCTSVHADSLENISFTLEYSRCLDILSSPYTADIESLGATKCLLLEQEDTQKYILLSEKNIYLGSNIISTEILSLLKEKYYRGQKMKVLVTGESQEINSTHTDIKGITDIYTLKDIYSIQIMEDEQFLRYQQLSKHCGAISFFISCEEIFYSDIQDKINIIFDDIFLKGEQLFSKDIEELQNEKQKILTIRNKFEELKTIYTQSEKIVFLLESIDYKLSIYQSLIEDTISENKNNILLKQLFSKTRGYYQRNLGIDVFLYKGELYQYIYYKNSLVNTTKLDVSHFSPEEIETYNISETSKSEIFTLLSKKYSLGELPEDFLQDYRLIYKKWFDGPTSILTNIEGNRYIIPGLVKSFKNISNVTYFTSNTIDGNIFMIGKISGKNKVEELYRVADIDSKITSYSIDRNIIIVTIVDGAGEYTTITQNL